MNGATALPCAITSKPPKTIMTSIMGSSQNFFRARINAHISRKNEINFSS